MRTRSKHEMTRPEDRKDMKRNTDGAVADEMENRSDSKGTNGTKGKKSAISNKCIAISIKCFATNNHSFLINFKPGAPPH